MIKAVIFDCFGVLTTDAWLPFKEQHFGHDRALFDQATDFNKRSDAGFMDYTEFVQEIAALAGIDAATTKRAIENNVPNEPLYKWIAELKESYNIGMLSNASGSFLTTLFTPEHLVLFDATALSYETGFIKPNAGAYTIIADRLGVEPEDCVLIDDQERFCSGANEAGMQAIWYKSVDQTKADFQKLIKEPN